MPHTTTALSLHASSIPQPLTSLVGREADTAAVAGLLKRNDVRLVTLTGPGGVGKTRLAIEVARMIANDLRPGATFVSLASITEPSGVILNIGRAIGIPDVGDLPCAQRINNALAGEQLLLVLDNFEHVIDAAPDIGALLAGCPGVKALVTSRSRLRLSGEWEYAVGPLALPDADDQVTAQRIERAAAVRLFVTRASAAKAGFRLSESNAGTIAAICQRLGGLPLAIELAAARVGFLPPSSLLDHLDQRRPVLTGGGRDRPARHQTMRDAIDWSYSLLSESEKFLFRRLAVFTGGFTIAAADAVGSDDGAITSDAVYGCFASLAEQSLLHMTEPLDAEPRFAMLEPIRDFAREMLAASGELDTLHDAHARYYLDLVGRDWPPFGPGRVARVEEADREAGNLYAALGWLVSRCQAELGLRLAYALFHILWFPRGQHRDQQIWMNRVVELPGAGLEAHRAAAYVGLGFAESFAGHLDAATSAADQALTNAQVSGNAGITAWALNLKGGLAAQRGEYDLARSLLENALATCLEIGDTYLHGWILTHLGMTAGFAGDNDLAQTYLEQCLLAAQSLNDPWQVAAFQYKLAVILERQGDVYRSAQLDRQVLATHWQLGSEMTLVGLLDSAACYAVTLNQCAEAVGLLSAADRVRRRTGTAIPIDFVEEYDRVLETAKERLGDLEFAAAWTAGETMTVEALVAKADRVFADWGERGAGTADRSRERYGLTSREIEVLHLVATGMTNREIADALFISVETVKVHVRSILTKLELDSRTAVAGFAIRHRLV
jgi:non-specific serine/threonine protein kinase